MTELLPRVQANLDVVLDESCAELPHGGDNHSRKIIAEQLIAAAEADRLRLGELRR